jgi:hypothetical protein
MDYFFFNLLRSTEHKVGEFLLTEMIKKGRRGNSGEKTEGGERERII